MNCELVNTLYGQELNSKMTLREAIELLRADGLLNIGELAERAISKLSGVALCTPCTPNIDTVSGKQIKHATVKKPASSDNYMAYISRNTNAPILCVITNPHNGLQYYLHIPYSAHRDLSGNCISIMFGKDGCTPGMSKWWNYEVDTFRELCELAK